MKRLDAFLAREVLRLRARYQLSLDEFRGLYVSDEQVDALLAGAGAAPVPAGALPPRPADPAFEQIVLEFRLDEVAADVLLLALAPDIDPKYATLIAYLNDDVRRRWPSVDLARRLFGAGPELAEALAPGGNLFSSGLLVALAGTDPRTPLPLQEFAANPVLAAHLLGRYVTAPAIFREEPGEADAAGPLHGLADGIGDNPLAVLTGAGGDRVGAVRGLARLIGRGVLRAVVGGEGALRDAMLAARLENALLVVEADDAAIPGLAPALRDTALQDRAVPVFLLAPPGEAWRPALAGCAFLRIDFPHPDRLARRQLWAAALRRAAVAAEPEAVADVADRFRLSARQIAAASRSLRVGTGRLDDAARAQAGADLGNLAQRVAPDCGWADLVLPDGCLRLLRQFAGAIRHRDRVFSDWGLSGGPGLTALFGGGPGTGKTMSAGVLARECGLDLWRIDLSSVVSKYIGETEKHLDRIFSQARDGNAILFFDEADAIFGKRSEVKDAHDRYANIEVAFLLQRLELHDGVVILATNLARNIDPAFARRLHFVIDFPQPDPKLRERLWRAALPPHAPVAQDLDFGFLARQFAFAGGDIRVAVLDAAFAAAADGEAIDMVRLLQAVGRQLLKQGRVPQGSDFRHYQTVLAAAAE